MDNKIPALKTFYQDVDKRNRQGMIDFLSGHFRYNTMNSWNQSTSYANKVKIWDVIPDSLQDKVYEMSQVDGFYDPLNDILNDWGADNNWDFQSAFNGRSGGYLVMYKGYRKLSDHKSYCPNCGQRNFKTVEETNDNKCGRCGKNSRVNKTFYDTGCWPGKNIDMGEDFQEWDMYSLRKRVELVQSFDKMCDAVVSQTIHIAQNLNVVEETIMVPKQVKHLE